MATALRGNSRTKSRIPLSKENQYRNPDDGNIVRAMEPELQRAMGEVDVTAEQLPWARAKNKSPKTKKQPQQQKGWPVKPLALMLCLLLVGVTGADPTQPNIIRDHVRLDTAGSPRRPYLPVFARQRGSNNVFLPAAGFRRGLRRCSEPSFSSCFNNAGSDRCKRVDMGRINRFAKDWEPDTMQPQAVC